MLVLTRRAGESVNIGDDIVVIVIGVVGGRVKLGFEAPSRLPVNRSEIDRALRSEGRTHIRGGANDGPGKVPEALAREV